MDKTIAKLGMSKFEPRLQCHAKARAFTLIEMVIALAATGLILGAAYATLFSGLDAYRFSAYRGETYSVLQRAIDRIFEDLSSAHLMAQGGSFKIENDSIESEKWGEVSMDRLVFQSLVAKLEWSDKPQEELAEIEYYIDTDEETAARWLVRRIQSPVDSDLESGGSVHLVGPKVIGIEIQAYDGAEWLEEWDSTDKYPEKVQLKIYMEPPQAGDLSEEILNLSSAIWLPRSKGQPKPSPEGESTEEPGQPEQPAQPDQPAPGTGVQG